MIRIKRGVVSHKKHKKLLKKAKGYYGSRSRVYRVAYQAVIKAHQYSYRDRKIKKRQFRKLWIIRINALVRKYKTTYGKFIFGLKKSSIEINRKNLSYIANFDENAFKKLIYKSKNIYKDH